MAKPKVFLTGRDTIGWALDDDLRQTRKALEGVVDFVSLEEAEVVHSLWWEPLLDLPRQVFQGKKIICHLSGEPFRYLQLPRFSKALSLVDIWVSQSGQAQKQCEALKIPSTLIPYAVDTSTFFPLPPDDEGGKQLKAEWSIPSGRFIIANFHRDTEGADLSLPKLVKGPDVFAEIVHGLKTRGLPVHVLLAGPRRFWLRQKLTELGIPFTYVGEIGNEDDIEKNCLPQALLNQLYNVADIYVVTSRSEGGPRSILEAAASRCKVISTRVGIAEDVLDPRCIYTHAVDAIERILHDQETGVLSETIPTNFHNVMNRHLPQLNSTLFDVLYRAAVVSGAAWTPYRREPQQEVVSTSPTLMQRLYRFVAGGVKKPLTVGLWHKFVPPPFGGGNQFMLALRKGVLARGICVVENRLERNVDAYVLNAVWFDVEKFRRYRRDNNIKIIHRIDGPISLIRGKDQELDDLCFKLNAELADATVLQSIWTYRRSIELGYEPVRPVVILNAVDPEIFHRKGRIEFDRNRKIRLISSSWSDNPRKGGALYKWLDENLDWNRFDYTFVGRSSEKFSRIKQVPPVPSGELADLLRQHDIYITASRNDPCSNAVIEGLACGLPVLYLNDGGHPELVGQGGLPFVDNCDVLEQLDRIVQDYRIYQNLIAIPTLQDVADRYISLVKEILDSPNA